MYHSTSKSVAKLLYHSNRHARNRWGWCVSVRTMAVENASLCFTHHSTITRWRERYV